MTKIDTTKMTEAQKLAIAGGAPAFLMRTEETPRPSKAPTVPGRNPIVKEDSKSAVPLLSKLLPKVGGAKLPNGGKIEKDGTMSFADQAAVSMDVAVAKAVKAGKVTKLPAGVAEGAYKNGQEAKDKTPIEALRGRKGKADKLGKLGNGKAKDASAGKPAGTFSVGPHEFKGKNAMLMQAVCRKAGASIEVGGVKLSGKEPGATMAQLLKITGWAACRSTLGKLCRDARKGDKLKSDEGEGDKRRYWLAI